MNRTMFRGIQYSKQFKSVSCNNYGYTPKSININSNNFRSIVSNNINAIQQQQQPQIRSFSSLNINNNIKQNQSIFNQPMTINNLRRYSTQQQQQQTPKETEQSKQTTSPKEELKTEEKIVDQSNTNQQQQEDPTKNLSTPEKIKYLFKQYGLLAVVVHFSIYGATLGGLYLALSNGVDVEQVFTYFGIEQTKLGKGLGVFALAFALTKLTGVVRVPLTLILVPVLSRYIRRAKLTY
ncbi:hypothetical protein PPL_04243 [Heterostelium album PN500]|uniref:DUF1279 domain-containing protein n=1 Tax=Heterostelium pallidum (strain ATCC 26659 / Pp 5 / PN500) TaxID=670386 RepID=D3B712_HETP5|nr:hypothetical protein PPL_04243 [Heterostelium album PN500]EFA82555.1 hypothetical protein PPL_04243 [Heterostelium album PN500]|eukprot:XP_020434672.1 hypothetical protein PPL_04243 [Heterostelium album PN500]